MDLKNPEKILVVQIGKIGDMILTTPLFYELKKLFPRSELTVLASEINSIIPSNHSSVDKVLIFKKNIFRNLKLFKLKFSKVDLWIDTKDNYSKTSELLVKTIKPHTSIGFSFQNHKKTFSHSLNGYASGKHAVDINLSAVNFLSGRNESINSKPSYNIPSEIRIKYDEILKNDGKVITVNVSAGNKSRYIPTETLSRVISELLKEKQFKICITGTEADKEIINYLIEKNRNENIRHIKTENILETSELIRRSYLVITPDTSIVHVCSAFNVPVTAVYPGVKWNAEKFSPISDYSETIISDSKNSVKDVSPEKILEKVKALSERIDSGNAESRTRVRKEDH